MTTVGFIGLGLMGKPMSKRLVSAGHQLVVYNRNPRPVKELVDLGAESAESPRKVGERAEIVITMLPDSSDVRQVILGGDGVASGVKTGSVVVDCSTIAPAVEMEIAQQLLTNGVAALDAPVTGGTGGAESGTLTFMVGGSAAAYERCVPLFKAMGKNIFHMGTNGMGSFTKLCNQICVSLNLLGTCEALLLASRAGLDPKRTIEVLETGAANSWQLLNFGPKMLDRDFRPGFKIQHLKKDLRIVSEACEKLSLPSMGTALVHELLKAVENEGLGESGTPALVVALEKLAGHEIGQG
jgi:2-hydroxy-3-oxopropionate reductase